jgi:hypothetical protein
MANDTGSAFALPLTVMSSGDDWRSHGFGESFPVQGEGAWIAQEDMTARDVGEWSRSTGHTARFAPAKPLEQFNHAASTVLAHTQVSSMILCPEYMTYAFIER